MMRMMAAGSRSSVVWVVGRAAAVTALLPVPVQARTSPACVYGVCLSSQTKPNTRGMNKPKTNENRWLLPAAVLPFFTTFGVGG